MVVDGPSAAVLSLNYINRGCEIVDLRGVVGLIHDMTSFFEKKIKKHSKKYPELFTSQWLSSTLHNSSTHHLALGSCTNPKVVEAVSSQNYKSLNATITAEDICANSNLCRWCKDTALAEDGFLGNMLKSQIRLLETKNLREMLELYWPGRNRTIIDEIHYKFWKNTLNPALSSASVTKPILYCATFGSLHYSANDRSVVHSIIISSIESGFIHKSSKGAVWFYTDTEKRYNEYEIVLEENVTQTIGNYTESINNLSELCDNAMRHGGWDDVRYWWRVAKKL